MENKVFGYKSLKANLTNKYGQAFEIGSVYKKETDLQFGINGHGFHFCAHLEDTFRYFNPVKDNVCCKVVGSGKVLKVSDYAYHSSDMYVSSEIQLIEILTREQIFEYALSCDMDSLERMLSLYCFQQGELVRLKAYLEEIDNARLLQLVENHQTGDASTFKRERVYLYGKM